ncbi:MAG: rhomboid family intramembrane serine protease, partial [Planctomycetota bacterium]
DAIVHDAAVPREVLDRAQVADVDRPDTIPMGVTWAKPIVDPVTNTIVAQEQYRSWHALNGYGHFSLLHGFLRLEAWRLVTFQFLHADLTHLFFNMLGLFIFGGLVEQYLGSRRYLAYYLICGIGGGLLYLFFVALASMNVPLPGTLARTGIGTPLIGASAGVFGVVVACARIVPDMRIMLLIPPIPVKIKWIAYFYVAFAAFNLLRGGDNAGGDAAHIGGAIAGYFFIRNQHLLRGFLDFGAGSPKPKPNNISRRQRPSRTKPPARRAADEEQIDRILAKVKDQGLQSLTKREQQVLKRASESSRDGAG